MRRFSLIVLLFLAIFTLSGCLTAQYKEYKFHFDTKTSGTLTIVYTNIFADVYEDEDQDSVAEADYKDLADTYVYGSDIEDGFPEAKVLEKVLFEENHQLCAKIVLQFDDPAQVHLYKYDKKSPWMFSLPSDETFFESNGVKEVDFIPVVFWDKKVKGDFHVLTSIQEPEAEDVSLLSKYTKNPISWKN